MSLISIVWDELPESWRIRMASNYFNPARRKKFYAKVAELYDNGVKVDDIMRSLLRRATASDNTVEMYLYKEISDRMAGKGFLSDGTTPFVPDIDQILIQAGEKSGNLSHALRSLADLNEKVEKIKGLIRKALTHPTIIFSATIAVVVGFGLEFFPVMEEILPKHQWPWISLFINGIANFVMHWWFVVFGIIGAVAFLIAKSMPRLTGELRIMLDKYPPWSIYRLSVGGGWLLSISAMLEAGMVNKDVMQTILNGAIDNPWLYERTQAVMNNLAIGQNLGYAIDTEFIFPDGELLEDMKDYSISTNFSNIMTKIGKDWVDSSVAKIEKQSAIVNNISTALAAVFIGMLAASMVMLSLAVNTSFSSGSGF